MHKVRIVSVKLVLLFFLLSLSTIVLAQTGKVNLKGKVVTESGEPIADAVIILKQTSRSVTSNNDGNFDLGNVMPGDYDIDVTNVSYKKYSKHITLQPNEIKHLLIKLENAKNELDVVTITAGVSRFNKKETDDVARLPLKNIENPQVYSVIPKEILTEQMTTDYKSIFKNVSGAGVPLVYNQGRVAFISRGFTTGNFIRNSISGFVYTNVDPANLEVLEAVKGPSGTLFNSSQISFGGLFNRVTKKPFDYNKTEISYSTGSNNLNRVTFDVNAPLTKEHDVLFRFNGALHTEQNFQDQGFSRNVMLAPSMTYKYNDRLDFVLDMEMSMYNAVSPMRVDPFAGKGATSGNIKDLGLDYFQSFTNNTLSYKTNQVNIYGQVNYKLSDEWKLQTNLTSTYSSTNGYVTRLLGVTDSTARQIVEKQDYPYNGLEIQQNIIGDFHIGKLRNRVVFGLDYYRQEADLNDLTINMPYTLTYRNPGAHYSDFNIAKVDSLAPTGKQDVNKIVNSTYSAYVSDVLNITDNLNVMMSIRADRFVTPGTYLVNTQSYLAGSPYKQTSYSPKFGAVYEVVKNKWSFFGNYVNGFFNQGGTDYNHVPFKPQEANQWELGTKVNALHNRLIATVSYYSINSDNTRRNDPDHPGYLVQDVSRDSKGIDADIIANPFVGFNIMAGYSFNKSKYTKGDPDVVGVRPPEAGPQHLANLWMSYRILRGSAKGLGFGIGGNYGSMSYAVNRKSYTFTIPEYKTIDASVFYDITKFRIGVKLDNLTNERYWSMRLMPQPPRHVTANIAFRF